MYFEHNRIRKNLIRSACFCWDSRLSLREMDRKVKFGETIGYGNSYLQFFVVISKHCDYTQYYMMLLEQCECIVVKGLAIATRLGEDQNHVCSAT